MFAWLTGLLLPGLTLALFYMAGYVRMTRAFVLESMGEDYLRTAKAKGLAPRKVLVKHSMRAALTPLVTMAGLDLAGLHGWRDHHRDGVQLPGPRQAGRRRRPRATTCR